MQIITYSSEVAKPEWRWVAYIVLPNGEYLGIMFRADSEDAVKAKAEQFYLSEKNKAEASTKKIVNDMIKDGKIVDDIVPVQAHWFAGKVWVKNLTTGEKRRVLPDQISDLGSDWVKGGPRS